MPIVLRRVVRNSLKGVNEYFMIISDSKAIINNNIREAIPSEHCSNM